MTALQILGFVLATITLFMLGLAIVLLHTVLAGECR